LNEAEGELCGERSPRLRGVFGKEGERYGERSLRITPTTAASVPCTSAGFSRGEGGHRRENGTASVPYASPPQLWREFHTHRPHNYGERSLHITPQLWKIAIEGQGFSH
jgi:hypothetical protein